MLQDSKESQRSHEYKNIVINEMGHYEAKRTDSGYRQCYQLFRRILRPLWADFGLD